MANTDQGGGMSGIADAGIPVRVRLMGEPQVFADTRALRFDTRKALALISFLAVTAQRQPRDAIAALLWPDLDHVRARRALRRTLSVSAAGVPTLRTGGDDVWLEQVSTTCDVAELVAHARGNDPAGWQRVVDMSGEPFLAGFRLRDAAPFEEWAATTADQLHDLRATTLGQLVSHEVATGFLTGALEHARLRVATDPLSEPAQADLIRLLAWSGDRSAAVRQYRSLVRVLDRELGVPPLPETVALHDAIRTDRLEPPPTVAGSRAARATQREPAPGGLGTSTARRSRPRPAPVPVVGRDEVLGRLETAWETASASGQVIGICAVPGMGRTALARLAATRAAELGGLPLLLTGHQPEQGLAFAAAADLVRSLIALSPGTLDSLGSSASDLAALVPALPGQRSIDGPAALRRLYEAARLAIGAAAEKALVTLILDDAQWLDEQSAELLAFIVRRCPSNVVVVVTWDAAAAGTALPRTVRDLAAASDLFVLEGLAESAVRQLLRGTGAPADQLPQIMERTRGIPLLVSEYAAAVSEGTQHLAVRDLAAGRLDAAPPVTQQVVSAAAVIGTVADPDLLRLTCGRDEFETVDAIEDAVRRGLLVERADQSGYDLPHDLLRDVAVSRIGLARKRLLHGRAADALARRHGTDPVTAPAGAVARHLAEAGREADAGRWYWAAAQESLRLNAQQETLLLLRRALALGHDPAETHAAIGEAQVRLGEYREALISYDQAASFFEDVPQRQGEIEHRIADVLDRIGDWELALDHLDSARTLLGSAGPARRSLVEADRARTLHRLGQVEQAAVVAREAADLAELAQDPRARCRAQNVLGVLTGSAGDALASIALLQSASRLAVSAGDADLVVATLNNLARAQSRAGQTQEALASAEQALAAAAAQGDRHRQAAIRSLMADLWHEAGGGEVVYEYLRSAAEAFAAVDEAASRPEVWTLSEW